jgi:formate dehydrogenase subunit gamma
MAKIFAHMRLIVGALALAFVVTTAMPVAAQQPNSVNPNAAAVQEQQLLNQLKKIEGRGTIPDVKSYVLEHPGGRDWREFHEVTLRWIGGIAIIGMLLLLVIFYFVRGSLRIKAGRSGVKIERFTGFERFVHWMTAVCFVILGLTGLNVTFGKHLLLPLIGPESFSTWSQWAKYAHNFVSFPFTLGVVVVFLIWISQNLPTRVDANWVKRGGGIIGHDDPPAYRFNAGQKMIYWAQTLAGVGIAITGYLLLFPFYGTDVSSMETAEVVHGIIAMLFIALILAHIYIGTLGMEGAFEGMGEGTVDLNWAKQHHSLWVSQEQGAVGASPTKPQPLATPAE